MILNNPFKTLLVITTAPIFFVNTSMLAAEKDERWYENININGDVRDAASLTVPTDRTFRGAWSLNGSAVDVDMAAARDIHKENLRAERKPRLDALDVDFMQALEAGTSTTQIATDKQELRDITSDSRIAAATTPDALKALNLATLLGE